MELGAEKFLDVIERQAKQGVDFMTLHCGVTRETCRRLRGHERIEGIVSRGGALLAAWIERTGNENPLFEHFDRGMRDLPRSTTSRFRWATGCGPAPPATPPIAARSASCW